MQTVASFFTTRVKELDTDVRKKLRHYMPYLEGILHMKSYLSADGLTNIMWWVDSSHGAHWDSKGHTRAMMFMGRGAIVNAPRKHKLNIGSSIESELVNIDNVLGVMMWCKYFMEAQGYTIDNNLLYQDNKSTILLAKNVIMPAGRPADTSITGFSLSLIRLRSVTCLWSTLKQRRCGQTVIPNLSRRKDSEHFA